LKHACDKRHRAGNGDAGDRHGRAAKALADGVRKLHFLPFHVELDNHCLFVWVSGADEAAAG
jgi:hypothetical protein